MTNTEALEMIEALGINTTFGSEQELRELVTKATFDDLHPDGDCYYDDGDFAELQDWMIADGFVRAAQ